MKSILKYTVLLTTVMLFLFSCEKDNYTGDSKLKPSNPTVTVSGIDAAGYNFIEKDSVFSFDVVLSVAQIVDVKLRVTQISGDATAGLDYEIVNSGSMVTIPAYSTTGKLIIKIKSDVILENTESFTLQIGDETTANATFTPVEVMFTIGNYTEGALVADLSWTTDIATVIGVNKDPDKVVDLRLLIIDESGDIVDGADGASFETFSKFSALDDGTYRIATDIFSTINAGDLNAIITLSLTLNFNQVGVINDLTFQYPNVMTNYYACDRYRTYLATIVKSGDNYTITKSIDKEVIADLTVMAGTWLGDDTEFGYESLVDTYVQNDSLFLDSLGYGWTTDWWGEPVIDGGTAYFEVNWCTGEVSIPLQYYISTTYEGDPQTPYYISGSGSVDFSGDYPIMTLNYDLVQGGSSIGTSLYNNHYMSTPLFVATMTLDPAGLPIAKSLRENPILKFNRPPKPVR
jgi:hypothetical protein